MFENEELTSDKLFALQLDFNCPYKWKEMNGDERVRFCGKCKQNVYNISQLTQKEAVELINEKEGDLCVRFYQRKDGTVITRDCMSLLGPHSTKYKFNPFALINSLCASIALSLLPILGPSIVTLQQGNCPIMAGSAEDQTNNFQK